MFVQEACNINSPHLSIFLALSDFVIQKVSRLNRLTDWISLSIQKEGTINLFVPVTNEDQLCGKTIENLSKIFNRVHEIIRQQLSLRTERNNNSKKIRERISNKR